MVGLPADAQVFLGRLTRLDASALVRLRPTAPGRTALWARLPWGVLVTREVELGTAQDATVGAAPLLAGEAAPPRRDPEWRWQLPPHGGTVVEEIPADRLRAVASAAAGTLREVTADGLDGRPVGARVLREALLDHVPIVVQSGELQLEVPQRLVQAVVQMGFDGGRRPPAGVAERSPRSSGRNPEERRPPAGVAERSPRSSGRNPDEQPEEPVRVRQAGRWLGLAARYGTAWLPPAPLTVRPIK